MLKLTVSGNKNIAVFIPEFAVFTVCFIGVPAARSMCIPVGAIIVNTIMAPPAVIITVCAVSGAVKFTVEPVRKSNVPADATQAVAALPEEWVSCTSSPTPIVVRVMGAGCSTNVSLVITGAGVGVGFGAGPGGTGTGGTGTGGTGMGGTGMGGTGTGGTGTGGTGTGGIGTGGIGTGGIGTGGTGGVGVGLAMLILAT